MPISELLKLNEALKKKDRESIKEVIIGLTEDNSNNSPSTITSNSDDNT